MSISTAPITETEHAALLDALGKGFPLKGQVLQAYRAGVRDGALPAEPRVFRAGDPEPAEPVALLDGDGNVEVWDPAVKYGMTWSMYLGVYAPLVEIANCPDFAAVVAADERRRGDAR